MPLPSRAGKPALLVALTLLLLLLLTSNPVTSSPQCEELTEPTLCGDTNQVVNPTVACASGRYDFQPMLPCCRVQSEIPKPCDAPLPASGVKCRYMAIGAPSCPPDSNAFCSVENMKLRINVDFLESNRTCCDKCSCYGDPHCESFDNMGDTWVICDARDPSTNHNTCPMSPAQCAKQLDQLGRPCQWHTNADGSKWVVGRQGSPCYPAPSAVPPMMLMYGADDFSLTLTMGERSIIQAAIVVDGPNADQYILDAAHCFTATTSGVSPWRMNLGDASPPSDPSWLPYTWNWIPLDGGDILWTVTNLPSSIDISIRCTRTVETTKSVTYYSAPRLNIESLVEPMNWRPENAAPGVNTRQNVEGFCATGTINKQGSTGNTDYIMENSLCQMTTSDLQVAKILCSPGVTAPGVTGCKFNWCKSVRVDWETCYNDINTYGWQSTWCSAYTMPNATAAGCTQNPLCRACLNEFSDGLSWEQVIKDFGHTQVSDNQCVPQSQLAGDLVDCQGGVTVEYEASPGNWVPYIGVPDGVKVCGGLEFDSQADNVLFINPVRVAQCSPGLSCLTDKCQSSIGFAASFEYVATPSRSGQIVDLYNAGILVCDQTQWPGNPTGCVDSGATPAPTVKMCPCPSG